MRSHIGRHTYGNTAGTVTNHKWEGSWKHYRFCKGFIVVGHEIYCFFSNIRHHLFTDFSHLGLGVSHCSRWISVNGTKVSLRENNRVSE